MHHGSPGLPVIAAPALTACPVAAMVAVVGGGGGGGGGVGAFVLNFFGAL
jgi:hypothetical protein